MERRVTVLVGGLDIRLSVKQEADDRYVHESMRH